MFKFCTAGSRLEVISFLRIAKGGNKLQWFFGLPPRTPPRACGHGNPPLPHPWSPRVGLSSVVLNFSPKTKNSTKNTTPQELSMSLARMSHSYQHEWRMGQASPPTI